MANIKLKHYLVASEQNDYKPWVVTTPALAVFCLVIWSLRLMVPVSFTLAAAAIDPTDLMKKINSERDSRFLSTLSTDSKLIVAAESKAQDMLARSYFAHIDPDGNYVWPRIETAGYRPYSALGENLAMDFTSAEGVVNAWMNSPTHRSNIVSDKFDDQGLASVAGLYEPNHDTIIIVSLFGSLLKTASPNPAAVQPLPAPTPPSTGAKLNISNDVKVSVTNLSGFTTIDVNAVISGNPTLVTAKLKTQSISLVAGKVNGEFIGRFTFDQNEDLSNQTIIIEARDKNGAKVSLNHLINVMPENDSIVGQAENSVSVSSEARVINILRIVFGIFAAIYMGFLAVDAIILHRNKIKREGIRPASHLLVFALLTAITLFM